LLTIGHVNFMFGWAKPVPVAAWNFPNPRRGMMLVAAAGPAMNFFLAWLAGLSAHVLIYLPDGAADMAFEFIDDFIVVNLVLGLFNLLPIPPLDGGRIMVGLLPEALARQWAKLERYGIVIVLVLVFLLPELGRNSSFHFNPVQDALNVVLPWARNLVLRLSGNG
jgi:Zn-dependent protease